MIIKIKNLRLKTFLGIYDWEKTFDRNIVINARIESYSELSCETDNIKDTIDYDHLTNKIKNFVKNNKFNLIEALARSLINMIMEDIRIKKCKLEIDKIGAVEDVESFSVTLKQERKK